MTKYYIELGNEGIQKITTDLENGNVKIQQVKMSAGEAVLTATSVGLNANGIITSCLSFMKTVDVDKYADVLGKSIGIAGTALGTYQTIIAVTDGDISNADVVGAISTALGVISSATAFIPVLAPISGITGVTGCLLGLISTMMTSEVPNLIEIQLENGSSVYLFIC